MLNFLLIHFLKTTNYDDNLEISIHSSQNGYKKTTPVTVWFSKSWQT